MVYLMQAWVWTRFLFVWVRRIGIWIMLVCSLVGAWQLTLWTIEIVVAAPPLTVHWRSVLDRPIKPGENFLYWNFFTRDRFCRTVIERWLEDSRGSVHPVSTIYGGMPTEGLGIPQTAPAVYPVPKGDEVVGGKWNAAFQAHWYCNPMMEFLNWPIDGPVTKIPFWVAAPLPTTSLGMSLGMIEQVIFSEH